MITTRTTALIAALSVLSMAASTAPAAFAVNSAAQGDITFQENHAKIKQKAESEANNVSVSGTGNSGGNTVISANVQTATVTQSNDNPHFNALLQFNICDLTDSLLIGC
jgi:hypothetical protein